MTDVSRGTANTQVMHQGILRISNEVYHQGPGISKSHLDTVAKSPAHYFARYLAPDRTPHVPTPAMLQGTAIHAAILEPDLFAEQFAIEPDISRRSNAGKAEYDDWIKANTGKQVLTSGQWAVAVGARDSVARHPHASALLKNGAAEQSFVGMDQEFGELVKCRTDWCDFDASRIVDVKSTEDASPRAFLRSVLNYRYHVQVPWYRDTMSLALGMQAPREWVFLAVEKAPPYAVGLYRLPEAMVSAARVLARRDLQRIVHCRLLDAWWDYCSEGVIELDVPPWARRQLDMDSPEAAFEGV